MEQFTAEEPRKYKFFHEVLTEVNSEEHPNLGYYIYKTIILNNLYGVDIMHEAVEIAKLRLFLKMVGAVDINIRKPNYGLEPLPDVDFYIRAGNTLVGFASEDDFKRAVHEKDLLFAKNIISDFEDEFTITAKVFNFFKDSQTQNSQLMVGRGDDIHKKTKHELQKRLDGLNEKLNEYLASTYGINKEKQKKEYTEWLASHQPFHWLAEFYEIINGNGGFDVVIGNPPYVTFSKISYQLKFDNFSASDIYGYIIKRVFSILRTKSRHGFIVMHNIAFSKGFKDVRQTIRQKSSGLWLSFYARIPAGLFSGDVRVRNCIYLIDRNTKGSKKAFSTRIHRWFSESRPYLLEKLEYAELFDHDIFPMYGSNILSSFFSNKQGASLQLFSTYSSPNSLYYKQSAYNWIAVSPKPAPCYSTNGRNIQQSQVKPFFFSDKSVKSLLLLLFNGKLFFSYWLTFGDEFHLTKDNLLSFRLPIKNISSDDIKILEELYSEFIAKLNTTLQFKLNAGKKVGTYNTSKLWYITDQSDAIFLKYLCNNSTEVHEAIQNHVHATVLTQYN
jgi:Eco57I restriction-modification methylase